MQPSHGEDTREATARGGMVVAGRARMATKLALCWLLLFPSLATADELVGKGETIEIHDPLPPPVLPKAKKDARILPKYSDDAVLSDAWEKAWLLLDVDTTGSVTRVKMLKRPGHDLEKI